MKTTLTEKKYIRRLANGAVLFFGSSAEEQQTITRNLNRASFVDSPADMRRALKIKQADWDRFLTTFFAKVGRVTEYGGTPYAECQEVVTSTGTTEDPAVTELKAEIARKEAAMTSLREELASGRKQGPVEIHVKLDDGKKTHASKIKTAHMTMPELLMRCAAGLNVYLVGPAGSGKTTAGEQVADTLRLDFGFMSVGPQTTKTDIFGFMSASGAYVATEFRRRYEEGGVFLFDEMDAGNGGVLTSVNAALAGKTCAFPDKMVKRHPKFICIGAGNTYGTGPDRVYVGRQELDGASLDRFDFLEWGYDEGLEMEIAKTLWEEKVQEATEWTTFVQRVRKAVNTLGIRHIVSPRATFHGIKNLKQGIKRESVLQTTIWKNLKPDVVNRITEQMTRNIGVGIN